jgi:hypothetical protein
LNYFLLFNLNLSKNRKNILPEHVKHWRVSALGEADEEGVNVGHNFGPNLGKWEKASDGGSQIEQNAKHVDNAESGQRFGQTTGGRMLR